AFELDGSSVIVSWLPTYHDMGLIGGVLQPLWAGASCVMMSPGAFLRRPARWLEAISRYRGTTSGGPNFAFDLCVRRISAEERADLDLGSWRVAFNGAEPIHSGTVERFARAFADSGFERAAFLPCYGLAEATLFVSGGPRRDPPVLFTVERAALAAGRVVAGAPGLEGGQTLVASGRPHQEVRIVDPETRRLAAAGTVGEIWLASPSIADGYWDRGPATRETFRARLDPPTEDTFLRTGDLGFLREGQLFVTGRLKDLVILRGRNHYPNDLERTAELSHPELQSGACAAFAVEDDAQEQLVLVFEGGPRMDAEGARAVAASIRRELGRNHEVQASQVVAVRPGTLPRTSSGKVQRYRCRQLFLAGELDEIGRSRLTPQAEGPAPDAAPGALRREVLALPETEQPNRLLGALARLATRAARLEVDALPEDAPLSSLGLDSLAAVEVAHALETGLEIEVSSADLLEAPSLEVLAADLAYRLRQGAAAPPPLATRGPELVEGPRPLSAAEHSIWLVDQLAPERGLYNLFGAAWVRGLDEAALERAVLRLTRRHPALRTAFESPRGEPLRRTVSTVAAPVRRIEGHGWDEATVERALTAEARRPFDLAVPPLLRLVMVRLADDRHAVLLGAHHLITDFWSWGVLTGELETLYRLELAQTADLPPAPAIDLDTIRTWQQERLERHAVSWLESWDRELGAVPEILDLPTDRPRPAVQSFRGLAVRHTLSAELRDDLEALARREDSTLFTLLAATFQVLLHRHTGQDDLVVGTPTAGRAAAALRDVVGCFVNPVPLRADLAGDPTFVDFLGATRRRVSAALHLQELPFGQLVEHRLPRRDASRQPLFQALFVFHRPHLETTGDLGAFPLGARDGKTRFAGLELTPMALDTGNALFDLTLTLGEAGGGLSIALEMAADLYDATTARRLIGHYGNLLRNLVETPDERLSRLEVWSAAERWQVLGEWNAHANLEGDDTEPATDLYALFAASARRWPAAVALELGDGSHRTYGELAERAERLARHLRHLGVGPEVPVAICLEREEELIVSMLAVLAAGGAYVPLDPGYPGARLDLMLRDSGARLLLARELPVAVDGVQRLDPARLDRANLDGTSPDGTRLDPPAEALAYVIYTSGSTGTPKGVAITHASALAMVRWALGTWTAAELETVAAVTSVCFDLSIFEIFVPLAAGGRIVLARDALALPEHPAAATVSLLNTVPSAVAELLRAGRLPAAVRAVNLAGEPLAPELARQVLAQPFVERLFDLYGPTEDTTYSTAQRVTAGDAARIGRPIVGTTADLRDHRGQPVPLGAVGEIVLGGDGLARGYVRRPARTAAAFVPDPLAGRGDRAPGARIYRTGDLARFDATGRLIFLGRRDHQVKLRGFRIELG
ncbi:MAG: amino acid adenylation domain-containing protein, partial [Acidobacteria bacterium]|nr:amino acid adenylation domain-containing protein [Acidobacteriota bacterium]